MNKLEDVSKQDRFEFLELATSLENVKVFEREFSQYYLGIRESNLISCEIQGRFDI